MKTRRLWLWLLPPLVAGATLRLVNLPGQVLVGDEVHALRAALTRPISELLVTFELADFCQPLSALYRLLLDRGVQLSELYLRLPILLASTATIFVLPRLIARYVGSRTAVTLAWLLALSPLLVIYGRMVRPYGIVVLLAGIAAMAFYRWWSQPTWDTALVYIVAADATMYFHLLAGFIVVAPFLYAAFDKGLHPAERPSWKALVFLAAGAALPMTVFLALSWESLLHVITFQQQGQGVRLSALRPVLELQAGSQVELVSFLFWVLAVAGWWRLWHRNRALALYVLTLVLGQLGGLLSTGSRGMAAPSSLNRYLLVSLPWVLLCLAYALATPWQWHSRLLPSRPRARSALQQTAAGLAIVLLFLAGPLASLDYYRSSFTHQVGFLAFHRSHREADPRPPPPSIYAKIARHPAPGAVLEFPFHSSWLISKTVPAYQKVHGRPVLVSSLDSVYSHASLDLKNYVPPRPKSFLESPARFLILHLDSEREERRIDRATGPRLRPVAPERWQRYRAIAAQLLPRLIRSWGLPDHQDPQRIYVWDLDRVRRDVGAVRWKVAAKPLLCDDTDPALCLAGGRFRVELDWRDAQGRSGRGTKVEPLSESSGVLRFSSPENWEMLVRIVDGCHRNQHFWFFAAAATSIGYDLRVTDAATGITRTYRNAPGTRAPAIADSWAFDTCSTPFTQTGAEPRSGGESVLPADPDPRSALEGPERLLLHGGRFTAEAEWLDLDASVDRARLAPLTSSQSGIFLSPDAKDWQMMVKILDACRWDNHYWVFLASTTDLGYRLRFRDRQTGVTRTYRSPPGRVSRPVIDPVAFGGCPR